MRLLTMVVTRKSVNDNTYREKKKTFLTFYLTFKNHFATSDFVVCFQNLTQAINASENRRGSQSMSFLNVLFTGARGSGMASRIQVKMTHWYLNKV